MTRSSFPPKREGSTLERARQLGHEEAAIFETFVVPGYLSLFGERLVDRLVAGRDARVCHVHCRTGYPDQTLLERLPNAHVHGCDVSEHAVALARAKATSLLHDEGQKAVFDYRVTPTFPLPFPDGAFSHAFTLHPLAVADERPALLRELARIVAPRGQVLVALPLRGSFGELVDLLRECALKHELVDLGTAVDMAAQLRPTDDLLQHEIEQAGFDYVEVDVRTRTLRFPSGRAFFEDPAIRLLLVPELRINIGRGTTEASVDPFAYARDAIDKYWSDGSFELTITIGVGTGRRR